MAYRIPAVGGRWLLGVLLLAAGGRASARPYPNDPTVPAAVGDSSVVRRVRVLPVPAFGYAPETKAYFGAVGLFTLHFHPGTARVSNAKAEVNYTARQQLILELGWNYFAGYERYFSRGTVHFSRYPDLYYGIGARTPAADELRYSSDRALVRLELLRRLSGRVPLFLGPQLRYTQYERVGNFSRAESGFAELTPARSAGLGVTLLADTRTNLLNPSTGYYGELGASQNRSGNAFYQRLTTDLRLYRTWHRLVVAAQLTATVTLGPTPFYDYALLGGAQARGYYYGRFRERGITSLQGEVRSPQWHRLGLAGFGGVAQLSRAGALLDGSGVKPNVGLGLRFLADRKENINLRLDYAWGVAGQTGFYVAFGEAF